MPKFRTQDYECQGCGIRAPVLLTLPDDVPSSIDSCPETVACVECGGDAVKVFSAPLVMTRSFPDGVDRGDAWKITKEAAKLKQEAKKRNWKKRGDENKEIKRLENKALTAKRKFTE